MEQAYGLLASAKMHLTFLVPFSIQGNGGIRHLRNHHPIELSRTIKFSRRFDIPLRATSSDTRLARNINRNLQFLPKCEVTSIPVTVWDPLPRPHSSLVP